MDAFAPFLIGVFFVFMSSVWMAYDASKNKITTDENPYSFVNGAAAWFVGGLLLWAPIVLWYLSKRSKVLHGRRQPLPSLAMNAMTAATSPAWAPQGAHGTADELQRFKQLLDSGAITCDDPAGLAA